MRHFHGIEQVKANEQAAAKRRKERAFVRAIKRVMLATASAALLILGGAQCFPDPVCQVWRNGSWEPAHGEQCMSTTEGCENETTFHYGINDGCFPASLTEACEYALDHNVKNAAQICGQD